MSDDITKLQNAPSQIELNVVGTDIMTELQQTVISTTEKEEDDEINSNLELIKDKKYTEIQEFLTNQRNAIDGIIESTIDDINKDDDVYSLKLETAVNIIRKNNILKMVNAKSILINLLNDDDTSYEDKVKACGYLLTFNKRPEINLAKKFLTDLSVNTSIDPKLLFNLLHIQIEHNKKLFIFLKEEYHTEILQVNTNIMWNYFLNVDNPLQERLLAAQYLFKNKNLDRKHIKFINNDLGKKLVSDEISDQMKADIADTLLIYGDYKRKELADKTLKNLSFKNGGYTIYDNAQNVHDSTIKESINKFVEDEIQYVKTPIITEEGGKYKRIQTILDIINDINEYISKNSDNIKIDVEKQKIVNESLDRIAKDNAIFSSQNYKISDILQRVWLIIMKYSQPIQYELVNRLLQELIDSHGTCSSGHFERIIMVLDGYKFNAKISWKDQIISNIKGRVDAAIKNHDESEFIVESFIECNDITKLTNIFVDLFNELYNEMDIEFRQYISSEDFNKYFMEGMKLYIDSNKILKNTMIIDLVKKDLKGLQNV